MRSSTTLSLAIALSVGVEAFKIPGLKRDISLSLPSVPFKSFKLPFSKRQSACPAVWTDVSSDLTDMFKAFGNCTDDALAAIRLAFHDCYPGAGCDGSIILAEEYLREENNGLEDIAVKMKALAEKHDVGVADTVAFAGAHAVVSCPLGPQVPTWIGRTDSDTAAPEGELPDHTDPVEDIIAGFTDKGFSARDLAALIGAHSTAKQFFVDPDRAGDSFDATPGTWDVTYYGQVELGVTEFLLDSDKEMSQTSDIGPFFALFTVDQVGWNAAFIPAWQKMAALGGPDTDDMIECTSALPSPTLVRRGVTASSFSSRLRWWGPK